MAVRPPFVDAHVHLWRLNGGIRYPWLTPPFADDGPNGSVAAIAHDYLPDAYRAEAAGWDIRGAVHVEAGAHPDDALAETDWLHEVAKSDALPTGIVAHAALNAPDIAARLEAQTARPLVRGIRHIVNWHSDPRRTYNPADPTLDPAWQAGFALLAQHGLRFDLQAYPGQFAHLATLIARHPDIPVIVNHAGMAIPCEPAGIVEWEAGMTALAALPNVSVKLSGVGFSWRQWTPARIRPHLLRLVDLFGTGRAMVASDFPTDRLFGSFARHLDAYDAVFADFSDDERRDLFGRNANRIYGLGLTL